MPRRWDLNYAQDDETTANGQDKPVGTPELADSDGATVGKARPNVDSTEGPDAKPAPKARPRKATLPK